MKTTTKTLQIAGSLLLLVLGACAPVSDDEPSADELADELPDDADDGLDEDRAGTPHQAAEPGPAADPERDRIDALRESSCTQELHPPPPQDLAAMELARGLVDPSFRVQEDQEQAARAALDEQAADGRHFVAAPVDAQTLEAQARYLDEADALAATGFDSPQALAEAKAVEKARLLGDEVEPE